MYLTKFNFVKIVTEQRNSNKWHYHVKKNNKPAYYY